MVEENMEQQRVSFGNQGGIRFIIDWRSDYPSHGPIGKTWGDMQLWVQDTLVWGTLDSLGQTKGITWSWIELLEFLGTAWPYLIEEEKYPIDFNSEEHKPTYLNELWSKTKLHLTKLSDTEADKEDGLFRDFLLAHDFSEALHGAFTKKLLCLRRGKQMLAATENQEWILSLEDTMLILEELGNNILSRLSGLTDRRSEIARNRWNNRDAMPYIQRWQIATGMNEDLLRRVLPKNMDFAAANDEIYRIKAAARMLGNKLSESHLRDLLEKIKNLNHGPRFDLSNLWQDANNILQAHSSDTPAMQGYYLANMLREAINCPKNRVEPKDLLSNWGVSIQEIKINSDDLDAIAVWRQNSTPTILLNIAGPRTRHPTGQRSTLAHEICHILVDLDNALPAVEVLGGEVALPIEQRANAFAAEFLLPRTEAAALFKEELAFVTNRKERDKIINQLICNVAETYGTSHEMAAWQICNSGTASEPDKQALVVLNSE